MVISGFTGFLVMINIMIQFILIALLLSIFQEIKNVIFKKNMRADIFRIQASDSKMYGYFFIGFIVGFFNYTSFDRLFSLLLSKKN